MHDHNKACTRKRTQTPYTHAQAYACNHTRERTHAQRTHGQTNQPTDTHAHALTLDCTDSDTRLRITRTSCSGSQFASSAWSSAAVAASVFMTSRHRLSGDSLKYIGTQPFERAESSGTSRNSVESVQRKIFAEHGECQPSTLQHRLRQV